MELVKEKEEKERMKGKGKQERRKERVLLGTGTGTGERKTERLESGEGLKQRERRRKYVGERSSRGEIVRRVGTGKRSGGRRRSMEGRRNERGVVIVAEGWISGRLTNNQRRREYVRRQKGKRERRPRKEEKWYRTHRQGREKWLVGSQKEVGRQSGRPGVVVFRNAGEHEVGVREGLRSGIPTVGRRGGSGSELTEKERKVEKERTYGRRLLGGEKGQVLMVCRRERRRGKVQSGNRGKQRGKK